MIPLIEEKREDLKQLCARYRVRRLELFGSAARGKFDAEHSDLDFLVEFQDLPPGEYADHYFGLLFALEDLFQRDIDLIMVSAIRNPYFMQDIASSRTVLYAAA